MILQYVLINQIICLTDTHLVTPTHHSACSQSANLWLTPSLWMMLTLTLSTSTSAKSPADNASMSLGSTFTVGCLFDNNSNHNNKIIIIIIIIIAFKFASREFSQPHCAMNTYAQVAWAKLCANHVQHIECLSRATCRVACHVVRRDSSAIKFDRVEIAFIWAVFYGLNHWTDEGEEKTRVPRENPWQRASEHATYYSPEIQAPSETRTRTPALVAGKESRRANHYTTHHCAACLEMYVQGFAWFEAMRFVVVSESLHVPGICSVHVKEGSALTTVRVATLTYKVAIQTCCLTQSQYTDTGPISFGAEHQLPGRLATRVPVVRVPVVRVLSY